jgi:hypothetical protein
MPETDREARMARAAGIDKAVENGQVGATEALLTRTNLVFIWWLREVASEVGLTKEQLDGLEVRLERMVAPLKLR